MSDASKIGSDYKAISNNQNAPVSLSKSPAKLENFEERFCSYLNVDFSSPHSTTSTQDAFDYLNNRSLTEKSLAARILLKNAETFKASGIVCFESYVLRNIGLLALAADVCHKKDADCLVKIIDNVCATLVENSNMRAYILGNMVLSNDVKKGFQIMVEGGEKDGLWHSRRIKDAFLIFDLKILVLSELVLSGGKTTLFFKSLRESKWVERAYLKKLDPSLVVQHSCGLIEDERWCADNCESYLIALIDMTCVWAAEEGWTIWRYTPLVSAASIIRSTIGHARTKVHEFFCGEKTEIIFFNLSDEDFSKISRAVFKHICEKLMNRNDLEFATRNVGELVIMVYKSFLDHEIFNTKRSRCLGIVRGMLEHIFLHLFQLSSSLGKVLWDSINALQELIQEHGAIEPNSFFQVRTPISIIILRLHPLTDLLLFYSRNYW
jgi:hypothetical protein